MLRVSAIYLLPRLRTFLMLNTHQQPAPSERLGLPVNSFQNNRKRLQEKRSGIDDMDERRLDRIEAKLDKLSEVMSAIVRVEEKLLAGTSRISRLEKTVDQHDDDIDQIKSISMYNHSYVKNIERFAWLLITTLAGMVAYYVR